MAISLAYLLIRCAFDGLVLVLWEFPSGVEPLWRSEVWWPELINAALLGYVPAVLVLARRGIERDLGQLQPQLSSTNAEAIRAATTATIGLGGRVFQFSGIVLGVALVFTDPSMSGGFDPSISNPAFIWALLRTPPLTWLIFTWILADFVATRSYFHMGRNLIAVDLLEVQALSVFARRGLRSALMWVIFSIIFSLFWLGDGVASQQNLPLLVIVLTMATAAFVVPLLGVHSNIVSVKQAELRRLRDEIRLERESAINKPAEQEFTNSRLANLIAYYQLVDQTREWPIDAVNLLRFVLYILIGLGSWLGGALVERLLESTIGA